MTANSIRVVGPVHANTDHGSAITEQEILATQQSWAEGLLQVGRDYSAGGITQATATADALIQQVYGYNLGPVLFKPTLANGESTFRLTHEGALSYFVGNNPNYQDNGFALMGWERYEFNNAGVYINGDMALTMAHAKFFNQQGEATLVEKTWGFKKDTAGQVRIILHHSSIPFAS
ncbi:phosphoribosyl-AMP cyclohydrolase [Ostreibacterium oceani]|uniref:Phosphoribosyl-AMP cyclohydrolase n=1 Tax=Ostreibacterium oceani TaxID=2654998 RepID=A0A6N7ES22_9GAMM|nr:phosphoribosyl-AMP cyclohydrolase [Ostreibacterium oceani]MPV85341.1 phosphoribosyl-AMP cyclohydrolase [Ostreibacterium oceani]